MTNLSRRNFLTSASAAAVAMPFVSRPALVLAPAVRLGLTSPTTFYVDSNAPDDSAAGDSHYSPKRTIQAMWNWCQANLDLQTQRLTIQCADGFNGPGLIAYEPMLGAGAAMPLIRGNPGDLAACTISDRNACFSGLRNAVFGVDGFRLASQTTHIKAQWFSLINFANVDFGPCSGPHIDCTKLGSVMTAPGVNEISGGGMAHIMSSGCGLPILSSVRYDIVNEPKFTAGFVFEFQGGNATIHTMTWNGTAKGRR